MSYDPRLSAYQIPYQPLFESTRHEIERSLFSLEEKLKRVCFIISRESKSIFNLQYKEKLTLSEQQLHLLRLSLILTPLRILKKEIEFTVQSSNSNF